MKDIATRFCILFLMGAAIMCGIRAVEWLIAKPANVIFICIVSETTKTECKTIEEMKARAGVML